MSQVDPPVRRKRGPALHTPEVPRPYGVIAEFSDSEHLIEAIHETKRKGYSIIEAYTPYPIEEVWEAIGHPPSKVPLLVLIGGILGCVGGYALCVWTSAVDYPINIGGRPFHSWPAFIPVTFETTVLVAGIFAVFGMLALNGLPMPYHPVFTWPRFVQASRDRYFLMILARDPRFEVNEAFGFMRTLPCTEAVVLED